MHSVNGAFSGRLENMSFVGVVLLGPLGGQVAEALDELGRGSLEHQRHGVELQPLPSLFLVLLPAIGLRVTASDEVCCCCSPDAVVTAAVSEESFGIIAGSSDAWSVASSVVIAGGWLKRS